MTEYDSDPQAERVSFLRSRFEDLPTVHAQILEWRTGIQDAELEDDDLWELEVQMQELSDALLRILLEASIGDIPGEKVSEVVMVFQRHNLVNKTVTDAALALEKAIATFIYDETIGSVEDCRDSFVAALDEWLELIKKAEEAA